MICCFCFKGTLHNGIDYNFRVKFGVPLDQVCKKDIPGPLLVSFQTFTETRKNKYLPYSSLCVCTERILDSRPFMYNKIFFFELL